MEQIQTRPEFTAEMRATHTILGPNMLPMHFAMIKQVIKPYGYNLEVLENEGREVVEAGLKYVHNDTCYPALLVIGQLISALESGKYDIDNVVLLISQTGGGCRASNYLHLLKKALDKAGFPQVPVTSVNTADIQKGSGIELSVSLGRKLLACFAYGDMLMLLKNQVRPYEINQGDTEKLVARWQKTIIKQLEQGKGISVGQIKRNFFAMSSDFAAVPQNRVPKIKVGIVGEIYVKFSSLGNNGLEEFLHSQGCEYMVPGLMGFVLYCVENHLQDIKLYGGSSVRKGVVLAIRSYIESIENAMIKAVKREGIFCAPSHFAHLKSLTEGAIGMGTKMGEGWLLPAEMLELCENGYENIVCAQPFGCLPNHIVGKGMMRTIKERYPNANITAIDYDPGAAKVNQQNRIKLMLAVAGERLRTEGKDEESESGKRISKIIKTTAAIIP